MRAGARVARRCRAGATGRLPRSLARGRRMKRVSAAPEEADIVDLSHEAKGVARVDGRTVFVADALPGERVVLRRIGRHRNFDDAILESVLRPSGDRVVPPCPHYG